MLNKLHHLAGYLTKVPYLNAKSLFKLVMGQTMATWNFSSSSWVALMHLGKKWILCEDHFTSLTQCFTTLGVATIRRVVKHFWRVSSRISCTQMYYICFIRVLAGRRWIIVGCYHGSRYKKRLKTTGLKEPHGTPLRRLQIASIQKYF